MVAHPAPDARLDGLEDPLAQGELAQEQQALVLREMGREALERRDDPCEVVLAVRRRREREARQLGVVHLLNVHSTWARPPWAGAPDRREGTRVR